MRIYSRSTRHSTRYYMRLLRTDFSTMDYLDVDPVPVRPAGRARYRGGALMDEQEDGYSGMFYLMLIVGIIGVLGFVLVAVGAGS